MPVTYVERLAAFIANRNADMLTELVNEKLQACLLFNLSIAFAAPTVDPIRHSLEAVHAMSGNAICWRTGEELSPADAAFRNAALISARGQNDTHAEINGHIGCVAIPAVIALAQSGNATAGDVCAALACAYDVAPLVARSVAIKSGQRGFRGTSLFATFAAAAGAARVLKLNVAQCAAALSIASQFCGGTTQCWAEGTQEWLIQVGNASRAGVVAALLAQGGMRGAINALEGPNGFYRAFVGDIPDWHWDGQAIDEILNVTFKPFPGCAINQLPVKTLIDCKRQMCFGDSDVSRMTLALHPLYARYPGVDRYGPFESATSAIMSAPFMLQTALENDTLTMDDFSQGFGPSSRHDRSRQIDVVSDDALEPFHCWIDIQLRNGSRTRAISGPPSNLAYSLIESRSLTGKIAQEWRIAERDQAHALLLKQVAALCSVEGRRRRIRDVFDMSAFRQIDAG
ncbi:MmgE/PrpD family protein [Pandoraea anhela]|uniref:2-methylcitrate dehydratase n=1 Tax=Pandoraea anhela TaxID=2508295 RepID=A0A5E4YSU1_9BURK|nr:MmgE/PrpD family protein [Pandoraea anhela]VVE51448.1 2-methylcitrate dehydratase [Pandoraea anhela]